MGLTNEELKQLITDCAYGRSNPGFIYGWVIRTLPDNATFEEQIECCILTTKSFMEIDPDYDYTAANLLVYKIRKEVETNLRTAATLSEYLQLGYANEHLDPRMLDFTDEEIAELEAVLHTVKPKFTYLGLQTLYDRYLLRDDDGIYETPELMFMRVAMGLTYNEQDRIKYIKEFYNVMINFLYMPSTPTLFNAGTTRPQLSSCYLTTIEDDLGAIFDGIKDDALLSKYAGGLGNDWTNVRASGSHIKGTNGKSQGVIPFLKVANDTAVAVNQGGKRKGAMCAYLEVWHKDVEQFIELRKNTGDERRRTHDMNTALWIPDLFMKRVQADGVWTLFCPSDVPELHSLYGKEFEERYSMYEKIANKGHIKNFTTIPAVKLWRKILSSLFETGHPWITFKDACNLRNPQKHVGVINSSNLCTEITLNTSKDEIAVCNLGSINLAACLNLAGPGGAYWGHILSQTIGTAVRMLDNVIDINYYPVNKAKNSNLKHRPIGLGIMGLQDVLYNRRIPYDDAIEASDKIMEIISYYAIIASANLAEERGAYETYPGSLWSQGILPIDTSRLEWNFETHMGNEKWESLRQRVKTVGMRNSNVMAIAPTATISNICGVTQSTEPTYQNLYVKSNLSGEFTILNKYLVKKLIELNLWDDVMKRDLKISGGSVQNIKRVPQEVKNVFKTAFEVDPFALIEAASKRQKWIDQAQSTNIYLDKPNGKLLSDVYMKAWELGLKTTYYLRSRGATTVEKSTIDEDKLTSVRVCSVDDTDCEACQ